MMRVLAHTQSVLYRRLGRTPPKPGPAREAPPRTRTEAAQYTQRLVVIVRSWYDHVETIARHELGQRSDASFQEQLADAFNDLVKAAGLDNFLARKAQAIANKQAAYLKRVTKLPPSRVATQQLIEQYRQENVRLIQGLKDSQVERVTDVIRRAQSTGDRWEEVAPGIKQALGVGMDRARLIARDQTNKFNGSMMRITQQSAGVEEYTWSTTKAQSVRGYPGGPNTRTGGANHYVLEGTRHRWDAPPLIPGTTEHAHPGQQINCECVAIPVIPAFDDGPTPVAVPGAPPVANLPTPISRDLTRGGAFPLRQASSEFLRAGGAAQANTPITVVVYPDGSTAVRDGRHRITLARERGEAFVTGNVVTQGPRGGERVQLGVRIPI